MRSGGKLHMKLLLTWRPSVRDTREVRKILQITVVGIITGGMHKWRAIITGGMHKWRARHRMQFLLASHRGFEAYEQ